MSDLSEAYKFNFFSCRISLFCPLAIERVFRICLRAHTKIHVFSNLTIWRKNQSNLFGLSPYIYIKLNSCKNDIPTRFHRELMGACIRRKASFHDVTSLWNQVKLCFTFSILALVNEHIILKSLIPSGSFLLHFWLD